MQELNLPICQQKNILKLLYNKTGLRQQFHDSSKVNALCYMLRKCKTLRKYVKVW